MEFKANPEAERLAWICAQMSSAALGHLKPGEPYAGKPLAPIEEVLRLRVAATILAEAVAKRIYGPTCTAEDTGTVLSEAMAEAVERLPIPYAKHEEEG